MSEFLLAVDTATETTAVCLLKDGQILQATNAEGRHHSRRLLELVTQVLQRAELKTRQLSALGIGLGPGSFTGVRIGATFVKTLALVQKIPLVGVCTLEVLASGGGERPVVPVLNAYRGLVYAAAYQPTPEGMKTLLEPQSLLPEQLCKKLNELTHPLELIGDGAHLYAELFSRQLGPAAQIPKDSSRHRLRADCLGRLCAGKFDRREFIDAHTFEPLYLRQADAELVRSFPPRTNQPG